MKMTSPLLTRYAISISVFTTALFAQPSSDAANALVLNSRCAASKYVQFEKAMDDYIADAMKTGNAEGLSIVVVENDKVVYNKGFGHADKENKIPVEPSTLFHIGSITKLFTGIGIMQLAQKGKLDIDVPIQQYLPDLSIRYNLPAQYPITIRSIMSHQSGIFGDKLVGGSSYTPVAEDFRTYPAFAKSEYAAYSPNYVTAYSNFAVSMLGLIIERVSGQKYEEYIYNNILKPCGMWESGFDPKNEHPSSFAKGYGDDGSELPYYYIADIPAGFLASNSDDMANFIRMILNNGYFSKKWILYPNTLYAMYQPHSMYLPMNCYDDFAGPYNFGLSWMLENRSYSYLGKVVGHGGNLPPYNSKLLIAKDANIGVFVTANKSDFYPDQIAYYALEQAGKLLRHLQKPALPDVPPVTIQPDHLQKMYSGTYCILNTSPVEIYKENDTLFYQQLHAERIPLLYHTDNWMSFFVQNSIVPGIRLGIRTVNGQKVLCAEQRDDKTIYRMSVGNYFTPHDALLPEWQARMGTYKEASSGEPALVLTTDMLSRSDQPFLTACTLTDNLPFVVNPFGTSNLIIQGLGRSAQETVYFTGDTAHYSGFTFVRMEQPPMTRSFAAASTNASSRIKDQAAVVNELKNEIRKSLWLR